ncbi:MAG TPA: type II toxin-antitoxin system RelE/ParE family toxin [Acetobacteraceae bacterium]|nr:type II toxin-antitoxin system RelE/ParE family toxin [Acetobacteraceae bacterium]
MSHRPAGPPATSDLNRPTKKVPAFFFKTAQGNEPVRAWLKDDLTAQERKLVGEDIKTVEYGWPIGMPTCRPMGDGLHEVRTDLPKKIARVLFYVDEHERMVLLHGFVKKDQTTPKSDLKIARTRMAEHKKGLRDG